MNKASGPDGLQAEHFRFAPELLSVHLAHLFNGLLKHAYVPSQLRLSVIVPIVKNKCGDLNSVDNYKGG